MDSYFNEKIFNDVQDQKVTYDGLRLQGSGEWCKDVRRKIGDVLLDHNMMGEKKVVDAHALRSLPGCAQQTMHSDSAAPESLLHVPFKDVPLAIIYALEEDTFLKVWPFGSEECHVVRLHPNDMVIFRGDLLHAGTEYAKKNTRIHAYVDSDLFPHKTKKTYLRV